MSKFTELLTRTRKAKKLTKVDVAKHFGWTPMYYGRYENGYLTPHGDNINRFADFLGISTNELTKILNEKNDSEVNTKVS